MSEAIDRQSTNVAVCATYQTFALQLRRFAQSVFQLCDICLVMPIMMDFHCHSINVRLQGISSKRQRWEDIHFNLRCGGTLQWTSPLKPFSQMTSNIICGHAGAIPQPVQLRLMRPPACMHTRWIARMTGRRHEH